MNLWMTIGLPRSGKTTWAKKQNLPVVNPDAIRLAIYGKAFDPEFENLVWYQAKIMVKSLFVYGYQDVILDATNLLVERRLEWKGNWVNRFVYFNTDPELCTHRAIADDQLYLLPVIDRMKQRIELPESFFHGENFNIKDLT